MKAERQKKIDDQLEKKNNCCQVVLNAFCEDFGFYPKVFCRWPADLAAGCAWERSAVPSRP